MTYDAGAGFAVRRAHRGRPAVSPHGTMAARVDLIGSGCTLQEKVYCVRLIRLQPCRPTLIVEIDIKEYVLCRDSAHIYSALGH